MFTTVAAMLIFGAPIDPPVRDLRLSAGDQIQLAQRAIAICAARQQWIAVAIAAPDRTVRTLLSHDRASPTAIEGARRKAITAAMTRQPTAALAKAAVEAPAYIEYLRSIEPALAPIGGGMPIRRDGELLGAIGVSGAPGPAADDACATAALAEAPDAQR